jgi:hypothetical protein
MMKIIERTFNAETGKTVDIERDETAQEQTKREALEAKVAAAKAENESKAAAKAALLNKLGITAEEAQLLLGGN